MENSVVLDVDDRGRISVGKLLGGAQRVIATSIGPGRLLIENAVVVRAVVPLVRHDEELTTAIDASLRADQTFVERKPRRARASR